MDKYFDIYVRFDNGEGDGYSIPVIAKNERDAKNKAATKGLFEYEDDMWNIGYIAEITKESYYRMIV